ncbi:hypothetical protein [Latilactobacillus graminis]|uniref:hypothetical protein n=1 Tax=Latilactobacillus graminis TaxID=60519 RepID=UPI0007091790|nr:hypothetical protein [Latilactobacillus graminis]
MNDCVLGCNGQVKLPFLNGLGQSINLELGIKYTIIFRGGYYLALKDGEVESVRPTNMPIKFKQDNSKVIQQKKERLV